MQKTAASEYLFLGYPLHRFQWRDSSSGEDITFISPIFIAPCRFQVSGTDLELNLLGSQRVNEGWLERRFKNIDERKAFLTLVGNATGDSEDEIKDDLDWRDCARLLGHFYQDLCVEELDTGKLVSRPSLSELSQNGIYNRAGIFVPRKWRYTNKLHAELLDLALRVPDQELDASALRFLFPHDRGKVSGEINPKEDHQSARITSVAPFELNFEQRKALEASSTKDLSIVLGPPGTGKSRVVASALAMQAVNGANALFASRNHQALSAVVPHVNAITDPWLLLLRLARPYGEGIDHSMQAALATLVASDLVADERKSNQLRNALKKRAAELDKAWLQIELIIDSHQGLEQQLFEYEEMIKEVPEAFQKNFRPTATIPAVSDLEGHRAALSVPEKFSLSWSWFHRWISWKLSWRSRLEKAKQLDRDFREAFDLQQTLPDSTGNVSKAHASHYARCLDFWIPFARANAVGLATQGLREQVQQLTDVDSAWRDLDTAMQESVEISRQLAMQLAIAAGSCISGDERQDLADVLAAIENRSGLDSDEDKRRRETALRRALPILLKHYPLMATTNLSVHRDVPLEAGVFDLLIVDEASQCDIASVIPLLFRSRRALIVGDPMQLSHVTSLSAATDRHLRRQFHVDALELERYSYRSTSMFHLANTSSCVETRTSLRQHHRCHPTIAEYCNQTFYNGDWVVLTNRNEEPGLQWTHVEDDSRPAPGGGSVSKQQIEEITAELRRLQNAGFEGTVGVVTPFRRQADRIRDHLSQQLERLQIDRWKLLVNTADAFQGDERDIVLLSLVGGPELTPGSLNFLAQGPNRFNVAVSRAKRLLHVFGDQNWARQCTIPHIRHLVAACDKVSQHESAYDPANFREDLMGPVWEPALAKAMKDAGLDFFQQYPACGRYLDFAIFDQKVKLNIEVDGEAYHRSASGNRVEEDILRDQTLIASGWRILRFWVYELREDMNQCIAKIYQQLSIEQRD